jgi:lipopolysaccharide/colanic/teichoic acid biosynthesis glycosyltransferase
MTFTNEVTVTDGAVALAPPAAAAPVAAAPAVAGLKRSPAWGVAKRTVDIVAALLILTLALPVLVVVAVLIKLDSPGKLLFRQRRYGRDLAPFTVLKFRTMHAGVSSAPHERYIADLAAGVHDNEPGLKKLAHDPRVTRAGALLRKTSLDELPQLLNVLRGEMSLVGPRPALEYELDQYDALHFDRFLVRPGLTGLWQVSGRNLLGFTDMLDLDVEYAHGCGPRMDAMILLRTPRALVRSQAA